jgi:hypothetical protein
LLQFIFDTFYDDFIVSFTDTIFRIILMKNICSCTTTLFAYIFCYSERWI